MERVLELHYVPALLLSSLGLIVDLSRIKDVTPETHEVITEQCGFEGRKQTVPIHVHIPCSSHCKYLYWLPRYSQPFVLSRVKDVTPETHEVITLNQSRVAWRAGNRLFQFEVFLSMLASPP